MVIKRANFVSICLLAIATSVALTEYVMYSPVITENAEGDDAVLLDDESSSVEENANNNGDSTLFENYSSSGKPETPAADETPAETTDKVDAPAVKTAPKAPFESGNNKVVVTVSRGDTLASVLSSFGFSNADIFNLSSALSKVFNLRNLKVGQEMAVKGHIDDDGELVLDGIEIKPEVRFRIVVSRLEDSAKFRAEKIEVPIKKVIKTTSGTMDTKNLQGSIVRNGARRMIAGEAVRVLGQVVNLRSSRGPINYELLYSDFYDENGNVVAKPELLYASALVNGQIYRVYKFQHKNSSEYVDHRGVTLSSLQKSRSMLLQPLCHMKVTSKFGVRVHPVRGVSARHTGVDLKAGVGTPVRAAAGGVIVRAGYYSGYGKYVKIRHASGVETAYGHFSRISVRHGQHVRQGQIVGYTGVSGVTTGPHLHYEVIKNGRFINPLSFIKQAPEKLSGSKLENFNRFKRSVNLQVVGLTPSVVSKKKTKKYS